MHQRTVLGCGCHIFVGVLFGRAVLKERDSEVTLCTLVGLVAGLKNSNHPPSIMQTNHWRSKCTNQAQWQSAESCLFKSSWIFYMHHHDMVLYVVDCNYSNMSRGIAERVQ